MEFLSMEDLQDPDPIYEGCEEKQKIDEKFRFSAFSAFEECLLFLVKQSNQENFAELEKHLSETCKCNICLDSWNSKKLGIHCYNCSVNQRSIICPKCFVNGIHEGHKYKIFYSSSANCDCGDFLFWKKEGFCKFHSGKPVDFEEDGLTPEFITAVKIVIFSILENLPFLALYNSADFNFIIRSLDEFVLIGQSIRRICAKVFTHFDLYNFLKNNCFNLPPISISLFLDFLGHLISDNTFRLYFSNQIIPNYPDFAEYFSKLTSIQYGDRLLKPTYPMKKIYQFLFHAFDHQILEFLIRHEAFDWVSISLACLNISYQFSVFNEGFDYFRKSRMGYVIANVEDLAEVGFKLNNRDLFIEKFCTFLDQFEGRYLFSREVVEKLDDVNESILMLSQFSSKIDSLIENILKDIDDYYNELPLKQILENDNFPSNSPSGSVLNPNVMFSLFLSKHILAFTLLVKHKEHMREVLLDLNNQSIDDYQKFLIRFSLYPIRFLAVCMLEPINNYFIRNPNTLLSTIQTSLASSKMFDTFIKIFALVQTCLGITSNKNEFIELIALSFGLFDYGKSLDSKKELCDIMEVFLHTISCIIFDRICLNRSFRQMRKLHFLNILKNRPLKSSDLSLWPGDLIADEEFAEELSSYATRDSSSSSSIFDFKGTVFKLKDDSEWHPLLIFETPQSIFTILDKMVKDNPNAFIPFPSFESELYGLDLKSVLFSSSLFAIVFAALNLALEFPTTPIMLRYALNFILQAASFEPIQIPETFPAEQIEANSIEDLAGKLNGISFNDFFFTKISLKYANETKDQEFLSAYDILHKIRSFGKSVMDRLHLEYPNDGEDDQKEKEQKKQIAKKLKNSIMESFSKMQNQFNNDQEVDEPETDTCSLCQMQDDKKILTYPVYFFQSCLADLVDGQLHNEKFELRTLRMSGAFNMCQHVVHSQCVVNPQQFICPVDRIMKNCLLPIFPHPYTEIKDFVKDNAALHDVIYAFVDITTLGEEEEAALNLASELTVLEVRFRNNCSVLEHPKTASLIYNLFFAYYKYKFESPIYDEGPILKLFIQKLFHIDDITAELFHQCLLEFVSSWIHTVDLKAPNTFIDLFAFLRRAAIFEHFIFGTLLESREIENGIINWDSLLDFNHLLDHFNVKSILFKESEPTSFDENLFNIEISCFHFIDLPKRFIDFMKTIDISNETPSLGIDLITGQVVEFLNNTDFFLNLTRGHTSEYPLLSEYMEEVYSNTCAIFLMLTGNSATIPLVVRRRMDRCIIKPFYVDSFGNISPGFASYMPVFLSEERLDKAIEIFLSGSWTEKCISA